MGERGEGVRCHVMCVLSTVQAEEDTRLLRSVVVPLETVCVCVCVWV